MRPTSRFFAGAGNLNPREGSLSTMRRTPPNPLEPPGFFPGLLLDLAATSAWKASCVVSIWCRLRLVTRGRRDGTCRAVGVLPRWGDPGPTPGFGAVCGRANGSLVRLKGYVANHSLVFESTSFQNWAAGLPLMVFRVGMARRIFESRSASKLLISSFFSGIPFSGERSVTDVPRASS